MRNYVTMLRESVARWLLASLPNTLTTSQQLDEWIRFGGAPAASGIAVTMRNASGLAAMATCERVLSNAVAQLPLVVFREAGREKTPAKDLALYRLLHNAPNTWQTSFQFRKLLMRDLVYRGRAYALKVQRNGGEVLELIRLHPDVTRAVQDPKSLRVTYEHTKPDGQTITYTRRDVLHLWMFSDDGVDGISPIHAYRESIGDAIAIRQHGSSFFKNAARILGILEVAAGNKIGEKAAQDLLRDFNAMYQGNDEAHKTALLPSGLSFKPVSVSMEDAQWIEARKLTSREIFGILGVPPHKGGDLERSTFSNIEHSALEFVQESLMSWLVMWEQAIHRDLLNHDPALFVKFNQMAMLRGDMKARSEYYSKMVAMRAMSPNEVREKEDMNPYLGGDEFANPNIDQRQEPDHEENQNPAA